MYNELKELLKLTFKDDDRMDQDTFESGDWMLDVKRQA